MTLNEFRKTLRQLRREANMRQIDLALISGVGRGAIQGLETGRNDTQLANFIAIANTLGYEVTLERRK